MLVVHHVGIVPKHLRNYLQEQEHTAKGMSQHKSMKT
jgi:hypothetical protein